MIAKIKLLSPSDALHHTLLLWVLLPMLGLLVVNIALVYNFGHNSADRRHDKYLADASQILLDQLRTEEGQVEFEIHSGALKMLTQDKDDQVYFSIGGWQQDYQFGYADLPRPTVKLSDQPIYYMASYAGKPVRMMAAILPETDVASGKTMVLIGKTLALHKQRTYEWIWRVLPAQVLLMVFTGIMMWLGVRRGLRPLANLQHEIANRSVRDLSPLPKESVVAEIQPLITSFNELMERLDLSFKSRRQFIADAAHQLRTPLAGLKTQAELAQQLNDPTEIQHSLQQIGKAADHAAHLANQLLSLARVEPSAQKTEQMKKLNLLALARNTTEFWVATALRKQIDLGFEDTESNCEITGNEFLLSEMLNNLIDNALRYTPTGGKVTVRVLRDKNSVNLEVEDTGPGIPEAERERVFERFYRILGSNQEGCGLGLSIAREIIYFHDAKIRISSGAGGIGTLIKTTFPENIVHKISQSGKYPIFNQMG